MQGTVLILDGVSTNRIMLKVQLSAACYHVVQAGTLEGVLPLIRRTQPDLILCAMNLPDGDAIALRRMLRSGDSTRHIPMIAVARQNDRAARLRALEAGIDDVLCQPYEDIILLARLRSLLRMHGDIEDLRRQSASQGIGFDEAAAAYTPAAQPPAHVGVIARSSGTGAVWRARLRDQAGRAMNLLHYRELRSVLREPTPDALVVEISDGATGLRLLADLRARGMMRDVAVIAVPNPASASLAAAALDLGADDVMPGGFCPEELALRLDTLLRRKSRTDSYRAAVQAGLRAASRDVMTGLHNRRYALPALGRMLCSRSGSECAVMLIDLDHFKQINDTHGHPAGDAVLIETARRLRALLRPTDLIARIGGEEFLIALPATSRYEAQQVAARLCSQINERPYRIGAGHAPIHVTTSIGVVIGVAHPPAAASAQAQVTNLVAQADRALYDAKHAGRNQVMVLPPAA